MRNSLPSSNLVCQKGDFFYSFSQNHGGKWGSNDSIGDIYPHFFHEKIPEKKPHGFFWEEKHFLAHICFNNLGCPHGWINAFRVWCQMVKSFYHPWKLWPPNVHLAAWMSEWWMVGSGGWGSHVPRFLSIRYGWDWYILTVHLWGEYISYQNIIHIPIVNTILLVIILSNVLWRWPRPDTTVYEWPSGCLSHENRVGWCVNVKYM